MNIAEIIGKNIQQLMDEQSITAVDMAKMLGVTRQTLANYLNGLSIIDSAKLSVVADYFHKEIEYFLQDEPEKYAILFRTALAYEEAGEAIYDKIINFMKDYNCISKMTGSKLAYHPEQYNLTVEYSNEVFNINTDEFDIFNAKLTRELEDEIEYIANEQRKKLGTENLVGLDVIKALQESGIRVVFQKMNNTKLYGISALSPEQGCFIFINDDDNIPLERKVFSVAHEYGHILMHRSIYSKKLEDRYKEHSNKKKRNLFEAMADAFAGYFLCPKTFLVKYNATLNKEDLSIADLIPIKTDLQMSLMSLTMTLHKHGYINDIKKKKIFEYLCTRGFRVREPYPMIEVDEIKHNYMIIRNSKLHFMLNKLYGEGKIDIAKVAEMLDVSIDEAHRKMMNRNIDDEYISEPI